jgi:hypothetical protein
MNSQTLGLRVASVIFGLVGLGHLLRILLKVQLVVGECYVARRWNAVAVIVCGALCVWLWRLSTQGAKPKADLPPAKPAA